MFGNHVTNRLYEYFDRGLPADESRRVADHLMRCHRCRREYEEIRFGSRLMGELKPEAAPDPLWSMIERGIDQRQPEARAEWDSGDSGELAGGRAAWWRAVFAPWPVRIAVAMALVALAGSIIVYRLAGRGPADPQDPGLSWEVRSLAGRPTTGDRVIAGSGRLGVGEWIETDGDSRAQLSVGEIGEIEVGPRSRIQLVEAGDYEHRILLTRGKLSAFIWAPPGMFFVDTPSASAIDLGCAYTLEVDESGQGTLRVTLGWVAFERDGIESFVPEGGVCLTRPGLGPGTPYFDDAPAGFKSALAQFDISGYQAELRRIALDGVLKEARKRDGLTLWHLLSRANEAERGRIYDRLAKLVPPPANVTRDAVISGDRVSLDSWWESLGLGDAEWWRMWKGPPPPTGK